ncbi:Phage terminase, small subunit [compost metagenome]
MPPKQPLTVLQSNNRSHLTKAEIEQRKAQEEAVKPKADKIKPPTWLKSIVARKEFKRISSELQEINLISNLDVDLLAMYCQAYAQYQQVISEMDGQPLSVTKYDKYERPYLVENPLIKIQLKYSDEMKKIASQMGLSINSRLKLTVPTPKNDKPNNKFSEFMGNG